MRWTGEPPRGATRPEHYLLFRILGAQTDANEHEITEAFSLHVHRAGGCMEHVSPEVQRAFNILINPDRRQLYRLLIRLAQEKTPLVIEDPDFLLAVADICDAAALGHYELPDNPNHYLICFPGVLPPWKKWWGRLNRFVRLAGTLRGDWRTRAAGASLYGVIALMSATFMLSMAARGTSAVSEWRYQAHLASVHQRCRAAEQEVEALRGGLATLEHEFLAGLGVTVADCQAGRIPPGLDSAVLKHEPIRNSLAFIETAWLQARQELDGGAVLIQVKSRLSAGQPAGSDEALLKNLAESAKARRDMVHEARVDLDGIIDILKTEEIVP